MVLPNIRVKKLKLVRILNSSDSGLIAEMDFWDLCAVLGNWRWLSAGQGHQFQRDAKGHALWILLPVEIQLAREIRLGVEVRLAVEIPLAWQLP